MTTLGSAPGRVKIAIVVSALAFLIALCGLRGELASAGPTARASEAAKVGIVNFAFRPSTLTIAKGGSVTFSNSSKVTHTATRKGAFDTGLIRPGRSVTVSFKQKGTFAYHCEIHPSMHGKVIVD